MSQAAIYQGGNKADPMPRQRVFGESARKEVLLISLNPIEKQYFLPSSVMEALIRLPLDLVWVEPSKGRDAFIEQIRGVRPSILVGGWSLPRLPEDPAEFSFVRYVCYLAGSVRRVIPKAWIESGVMVTNWGSRISRVVAEGGLTLVLMCLREAGFWTMEMHLRGGWKFPEYARARSLFGRKVGIHGIGSVAQSLVELLKPFGCEIYAYSRGAPDDLFQRAGCRRLHQLEELFSQCDIVIEAEALTDQNFQIVQEKHLRLLKDGVFVNIARGELVDESALLKVAAEGNLRVGLDVYAQEPLPCDSPLRGLENICLSPHIAGPTADRRCDSGALAVKNIARFLENQSLEAVIPLEAYDRMT